MENAKIINRTVNFVIQALQCIGFFEAPPEVNGWHLRWGGQRLANAGYRAAATAEGDYPVMVLSEDFNLETDIDALIHESIHMAQIIKGDLVPGFGDGTTIWGGVKHSNLPATHERYFEDQPWEAEVLRLMPIVLAKMSELSGGTY